MSEAKKNCRLCGYPAPSHDGLCPIYVELLEHERNIYKSTLRSIAQNSCCNDCMEAGRVAASALAEAIWSSEE